MKKNLKAIAKDVGEIQFLKDLDKSINVNGRDMPLAYYNLIISIRDFKLYDKGIKPYRGWKPTWAREYFGIKPRATNKKTIELLEDWRKHFVN